MTFTLILTPNGLGRHPAIIHGYLDRPAAVEAGECALDRFGKDEEAKRAYMVEAMAGRAPSHWSPPWVSFTVIPGPA